MASRVSRQRSRTRTKKQASNISLSDLYDTTTDNDPFSIALHGIPGVGKSSFACHAPNPIVLRDAKERGAVKLKLHKQIPQDTVVLQPYHSMEELTTILTALHDEEHDRKTLVVDTFKGIQAVLFKHVCDIEFDGKWGGMDDYGFYSFYKGPSLAAESMEYLPALLDVLSTLRDDRGMNIITIMHSTEKLYENPDGPNYDRFIFDLDKRIAKVIENWCECELFMKYNVEVEETKKATDKTPSKGKAYGEDRMMLTQWTPTANAKNWYGLPMIINMGSNGADSWSNFNDAYQQTLNPQEEKPRRKRRRSTK